MPHTPDQLKMSMLVKQKQKKTTNVLHSFFFKLTTQVHF